MSKSNTKWELEAAQEMLKIYNNMPNKLDGDNHLKRRLVEMCEETIERCTKELADEQET